MAKSKDTRAVPASRKRPRGRPRKLHPAEEPRPYMDEALATGVDQGGGGDGRVGKMKDREEKDEADLLQDVLLDNSGDTEESGQVFTCVAAAVSMHRLSHKVRGVCDLRRHLQGVCRVTVSEATKDLCILHGSWHDIARAKLRISELLQQSASKTEQTGGQDTVSALDLIEDQVKDNIPDPKEELCTDSTPDLKQEQGADDSHTLQENQGKHNTSGCDTTETQSVGSNCGRKHKRSARTLVRDTPPTKRCRHNVTRQLTDDVNVGEETTPVGDVAVKRSRRTRKPTFSSSEWSTPHASPHRHRGVKEEVHPTGRGCPLRQQSDTDTQPAEEPGQLKQESEGPSKTSVLGDALEPVETVIKQDVDATEDTSDPAVTEAEPTAGTDSSKVTPCDNRVSTEPEQSNPFEDDTIIPYNDTADLPKSSEEKYDVLSEEKYNVSSTVCDICGFKSATPQGLVNHKGNYHSSVMYECDICFRRFGYRNVRDRHRGNHFYANNTIKESALIVHKMALQKHGRIENLSPSMLRGAVHAGKEESDAKEAGKVEETLVGRLLDWEGGEKGAEKGAEKGGEGQVEGGEGEEGSTQKNADCDNAEKEFLGNDAEEHPQEVDVSKDVPGEVDVKTSTSEENVEHSASSAGGSAQTGSPPRMFECDLCGARLTQAYYLKKHCEAVHFSKRARKKTDSVRNQLGLRNETAYECPHCPFVCYRIQNFTRHVDSHRQPAVHRCTLCPYTNKIRGEVSRHMRNAHGEKTFNCEQCSSSFRTQILLNCHVKQKHEKSRRTVCEICGKMLTTRKCYYKHKEMCHGDNDGAQGKVMCQMCGRVLNSQRLYDAHWARCHGAGADNEEEREIADALEILADGRFQCRVCLYKNAVAREVRRHIVRVHAEKRYKCDLCSAAFPRQAFLAKHVRVQHQGAERTQCAHCKKTFRHWANLKAHMNRVHLEDKPHQCSVCLRSFFDKRTLVMHMDLHRPEDERDWKYECKPCHRHFRFKCNYDYHMQDHTGQRPHVCATCSKAFKTKSMLETHRAVHSDERPFSCAHCSKRFKLQKYLDVHVLTHYSEKVCCAACGKIFGQPGDLRKHICRAIPVVAAGVVTDGSELGMNIEGLSVLGDGTTVTAILVENDETRLVDVVPEAAEAVEQQAVVCETADGGQLFPLVEATEDGDLDESAVAMYMCGLCHKLVATQDEINEHMQEHIGAEGDGDKLLAQLEEAPVTGDTAGGVPAVTVEEVAHDTADTVAYLG